MPSLDSGVQWSANIGTLGRAGYSHIAGQSRGRRSGADRDKAGCLRVMQDRMHKGKREEHTGAREEHRGTERVQRVDHG